MLCRRRRNLSPRMAKTLRSCESAKPDVISGPDMIAESLVLAKPLVLASASPRRRELLGEILDEFEVMPANIDEDAIAEPDPKRLVIELSKAKNRVVAQDEKYKDKIVVAADTVVYLRKVYNKPVDLDDAVKMLKELRGKWHDVYTGVTVSCCGNQITFAVRSKVKMKALSDEEIRGYVNEHKPLDKAGSYAIQEQAVVEKYRGSYTNIVGLPMEKTIKVLKEINKKCLISNFQ